MGSRAWTRAKRGREQSGARWEEGLLQPARVWQQRDAERRAGGGGFCSSPLLSPYSPMGAGLGGLERRC